MKNRIVENLRNNLAVAIFAGALLAIVMMVAMPGQASAAPPCGSLSNACATSEMDEDSTNIATMPRDIMVRTSGPTIFPKYTQDGELLDGQTFEASGVSDRVCIAMGICSSYAADVLLWAIAKDEEDGRLPGSHLYWTVQPYDPSTNLAMGRPIMVGSGERVSVRLFAFHPQQLLTKATTHYEITLQAIDGDGNIAVKTFHVGVYRLPVYQFGYPNS